MVVPAQAGTHHPCRPCCEERFNDLDELKGKGLWIPAFAGMTSVEITQSHTFSNGGLIVLLRSSHAGTGRFFERRNSGLNSFD